MVFINPWASYHPDDIPNLNSDTKEEAVGCLAGICGFIIASVIYVLLLCLCFILTKGLIRPILILIDSTIIYPILTIYLMELSFKIGDKFITKKKKIYER